MKHFEEFIKDSIYPDVHIGLMNEVSKNGYILWLEDELSTAQKQIVEYEKIIEDQYRQLEGKKGKGV